MSARLACIQVFEITTQVQRNTHRLNLDEHMPIDREETNLGDRKTMRKLFYDSLFIHTTPDTFLLMEFL